MSEILTISQNARIAFSGESLESGHITRAYLSIGNQEGSISVDYTVPVAVEAGLYDREINAFTARALGATSVQAAQYTRQSDRNSKRDVQSVIEALEAPNLVVAAHKAFPEGLLVVKKKVAIPQALGRAEREIFELFAETGELDNLADLRGKSIDTVRNQLKVVRKKFGNQTKSVTTIVAGHVMDELSADILTRNLPAAS